MLSTISHPLVSHTLLLHSSARVRLWSR